MKKLLILGVALLGLCSLGHTARADVGDDSYYNDHSYRRPDYYENRPVYREEPRVIVREHYCPPPVIVEEVVRPRVIVREGYCGYPRPYYHRHHPHVSLFLGF